eukprot:TRINITY_DN38864_c0_g1_i1.p1 TRINITY_DN38864_c0_g1~~TRINITY_DN38864_c0_g1_i1.p1  ORF type:complete len:238 (+),score=29.92 TRINITY_DN38864_c0_g1_i1:38-715(+)
MAPLLHSRDGEVSVVFPGSIELVQDWLQTERLFSGPGSPGFFGPSTGRPPVLPRPAGLAITLATISDHHSAWRERFSHHVRPPLPSGLSPTFTPKSLARFWEPYMNRCGRGARVPIPLARPQGESEVLWDQCWFTEPQQRKLSAPVSPLPAPSGARGAHHSFGHRHKGNGSASAPKVKSDVSSAEEGEGGRERWASKNGKSGSFTHLGKGVASWFGGHKAVGTVS